MSGLPKGWCWTKLGEVCEPSQYGYTAKASAVGNIHFLRTTDITSGPIDWESVPFCTVDDEVKAKYLLRDGDVVISRAGSVGYSYLMRQPHPAVFASYLIRFRPLIEAEYFKWYLQTPAYWRAISEESLGIAVQNVNASKLSELLIPLAPSAEQVRIVAKLSEVLSELDAGEAELKAAQKKLTQYRQSLLKAAVEGALTAPWREQQRAQHPPAESGAQLLQRILTERRVRWEAKQLAKFEAQGKAPPKDWQKKYPEPVQPDITDLPALPMGWIWATIDQLSIDQRYGSSAKTSEDDAGVPVLRMGNIQDGHLDLEKLKYLPDDHAEFPDLFLQSGDMLFNRTNSPELVGKTAVFRSEIEPCSYASYLIAVRFAEGVVPELVSAYINSSYGRHWIKSVVVQQVGQANVNGSKLAALAVPLPPEEEQKEILRCLGEQERSAFDQEANVRKALKQSTAQRQNILRAAFSGQLVPQDPSDEPAAVLLARIRAERAAQAPARKPRGRRAQEVA